MRKEQTPIEIYLTNALNNPKDFSTQGIQKVINENYITKEQHKEVSQRAVLEALEREFKQLEVVNKTLDLMDYYKTEVEPKYK